MSYKIQIFPGVNDNPLPPNEVNNANADYLIEKYNNFVDYVTSNVIDDSNLPTTYYLSSSGDDINTGIDPLEPIRTILKLSENLSTKKFNLLEIIFAELMIEDRVVFSRRSARSS